MQNQCSAPVLFIHKEAVAVHALHYRLTCSVEANPFMCVLDVQRSEKKKIFSQLNGLLKLRHYLRSKEFVLIVK